MTEEYEKARLEEERKEEYRQRQMRLLMMHDDEKARMLRINCDLQMDCKKAEAEGKALQHENWKIAKENEAIRKENEALKQKIRSYQKIMEEGDGQGAEQPGFSTPDEERKEAGRTSRSEVEEGKTEGGQERPVKEKDDKQFELMMRMMSSMQKMIEKKEESKEEGGEVEAVRNSKIELLKLPEWALGSAPLDLGDWVAQIEQMVQYQPGGLSEKGIILKNLESPAEASTLTSALTSLRRWLRWKRRAEQLGVAMPDPSVLVKGLNKITRKVLESHKELSFRVSLVKMNLLVESVPRPESVHQLAEHQIVYLDLKPAKKEEPKPLAKRFESEVNQKGKGYGKGKEDRSSTFKKDELCRFFLTDTGCKKGKSCGWIHQLDDQKRCWSCGAKDHFSKMCPRSEEGTSRGGFEKGGRKGKESSKGLSKIVKKEEAKGSEETGSSPKEDDKTSEVGTETDVMKNLLEEANRMLKSMTAKGQEEEDKMTALQRQLEELRRMKVFRLTADQDGEQEFAKRID